MLCNNADLAISYVDSISLPSHFLPSPSAPPSLPSPSFPVPPSPPFPALPPTSPLPSLSLYPLSFSISLPSLSLPPSCLPSYIPGYLLRVIVLIKNQRKLARGACRNGGSSPARSGCFCVNTINTASAPAVFLRASILGE